ncbi:MAG: hypothetical protein EOP85_06490 [Verrucomicrobiaceae bacterium]|nr:MAG: hypothetical protein EOP85_06490 [Verrucomicrobiaceae bacterium]
MLPLEEMKKAVMEQEMKVEEKRKALASIVRAKGIIYKGKNSMIEPQGHAPAADPDAAEAQVDPGNQAEMARKDAEERGRDAMAYIDAKQDFETDQNLLHYMRIKLDAERQKRRIEER